MKARGIQNLNIRNTPKFRSTKKTWLNCMTEIIKREASFCFLLFLKNIKNLYLFQFGESR